MRRWEIYVITDLVTSKQYVGKAQEFDSPGRPYGTAGRFQNHGSKARSDASTGCVLLDTAMLDTAMFDTAMLDTVIHSCEQFICLYRTVSSNPKSPVVTACLAMVAQKLSDTFFGDAGRPPLISMAASLLPQRTALINLQRLEEQLGLPAGLLVGHALLVLQAVQSKEREESHLADMRTLKLTRQDLHSD